MRQIPEKIDSKFRFVLLAATRAEAIMRGAMSKIDLPGAKPTRAGMEEILADKVGWEYGPEQTADGAVDSAAVADEPADGAVTDATEN